MIKMVECACGCGELRPKFDKRGIERKYIKGHGNRGRRWSSETLKKMSEVKTGEKHPSFGKKRSLETRKKQSDALKGKYCGENNWHTGVPKSKEQRIKMSNAAKGKKFSKEHKEKLSINAKNRIYTDETRKKMSNSMKKRLKHSKPNMLGKHHTKEAKRKISDATRGENNPRWKGGTSFEPYCQKFNEKFKESIREKFNHTCFICGLTQQEQKHNQKINNKRPFKLAVHHVNYNKNCLCDKLICEFVPLCIGCHGKTTNGDRKYWENLIMDKLQTQSLTIGGF